MIPHSFNFSKGKLGRCILTWILRGKQFYYAISVAIRCAMNSDNLKLAPYILSQAPCRHQSDAWSSLSGCCLARRCLFPLGEIRGSVSCPRTLKPGDSWCGDFNRQPFDQQFAASCTYWAIAAPLAVWEIWIIERDAYTRGQFPSLPQVNLRNFSRRPIANKWSSARAAWCPYCWVSSVNNRSTTLWTGVFRVLVSGVHASVRGAAHAHNKCLVIVELRCSHLSVTSLGITIALSRSLNWTSPVPVGLLKVQS